MSASVRMMAWMMLACVLWMGAAAAQAQQEPGIFRLTAIDAPARMESGQQVRVELKYEVVEPGQPAFHRPSFSVVSSHKDAQGKVISFRVTPFPWTWPTTQKAGDVFSVVGEVNVPEDFPIGPAQLMAQVARNHDGRWSYARLVDAQGKNLGRAYRHAIHIARSQSPVVTEVKANAGATSDSPAPLEIPRLSAVPAMEGPFNPADWAQAARIDAFVEYTGKDALHAATEAWLGHDGDTLYLAVVCHEPLMGQVRQARHENHDAAIWNNESIQIFLAPVDRQSYVQFIVDILNQRFDALGHDTYGYNPQWDSHVLREDDRWIVRVALPFKAVTERAPEAGRLWYANLARERWAEREISTWQPTFGGLHAPGRFGAWVFDSTQAHLARRVADLQEGDRQGWGAVVAKELTAWEAQLAELSSHLGALDNAQVVAGYGALAGRIDELERSLFTLRGQAMRLSGQSFAIAQAHPYTRFTGQASAQAGPAGASDVALLRQEWVDLAWNVENPSDEPLTLRFALRPGKAGDAPGQSWQNLTFLRFGLSGVQSLWQQALRVAAGDGTVFHDVISPRADGVVQVPPGGVTQVWLSLQPQADAPAGVQEGFIEVQPIDGSKGESLRLPLTVNVIPRDIKATRSVHVFMWNVLPPDVTRNAAWFDAHIDDLLGHGVDVFMLHNLRYVPRVRADKQGNLASELDFSNLDVLLRHAAGKFNYYYLTTDIWEKRTLRRDLIGLDIDDPAYEKAFKAWYGQVIEHILANGIKQEQLLVNPYDENIGPRSLQLARWMKEVTPDIKLIQNSSPGWSTPPEGATPQEVIEFQRRQVTDIAAVTDYWMPHYNYFFPDNLKWFYEGIRESGKPLWTYYYSLGPNEKSQLPDRHYLSKFWWAFQQDVTGIGWWAMQYYGDPWHRASWQKTYDTSLAYPVDGGVVPSRRWQAWRQGWQDHTLLTITRDALKQEGDQARLKTLEDLVNHVVARPGDPAAAHQARVWLKQQLLTLPHAAH